MHRWFGVALVLSACGDNLDTSADAPTGCPTNTSERVIRVYRFGDVSRFVMNAKVCPIDRPELCATALGSGEDYVDVPTCIPDGDFAVTATGDGYEMTLSPIDDMANRPHTVSIGDVPFVTTQWEPGPATFPPTQFGLMYVQVGGTTGVPGATVSITPAAGTVTYGNAQQILDPALTATSGSGTAFIGDVPAGNYDITITTPTPSPPCRLVNNIHAAVGPSLGGWESPVNGAALRVPVVAGATTVTFVRCVEDVPGF